MIYLEFWRDRAGYSPAVFERLLAQATTADRIPLCLLALAGDEIAGTVNLIENDDEARPHLRPWLAALIVTPEWRRRGIGTALVDRLLLEASRLGHGIVYLGTSSPEFYVKRGAQHLERARPDLVVMAIETNGADRRTVSIAGSDI